MIHAAQLATRLAVLTALLGAYGVVYCASRAVMWAPILAAAAWLGWVMAAAMAGAVR